MGLTLPLRWERENRWRLIQRPVTAFAEQRSIKPEPAKGCSLSQRERVRVRENAATNENCDHNMLETVRGQLPKQIWG